MERRVQILLVVLIIGVPALIAWSFVAILMPLCYGKRSVSIHGFVAQPSFAPVREAFRYFHN